MLDDTVTTSWKRLTNKVKETSRAALGRTTTSTVALEKLAVAMSHAEGGMTSRRREVPLRKS